MVSNHPEIGKNRMEKGPDGFFWMVSNRPREWVGNSFCGRFGPNRPQLQTVWPKRYGRFLQTVWK
jgi:hypothetical protein